MVTTIKVPPKISNPFHSTNQMVLLISLILAHTGAPMVITRCTVMVYANNARQVMHAQEINLGNNLRLVCPENTLTQEQVAAPPVPLVMVNGLCSVLLIVKCAMLATNVLIRALYNSCHTSVLWEPTPPILQKHA
jgi:hypothetical protein